MKFLQIALGILAAIGGFVDIGDLVFATQAGSAFGYQLIWAIILGVIGIATYAEMSGRVATVTGRPVFSVVRQRMGFSLALLTLVASLFVNLLTLAAETGGIAIVLNLFFDVSYQALVPVAFVVLAVVIWTLPFERIERIFGYLGLALVVFLVAAVKLHPNWHSVASGAIPHGHSSALYYYFAVGLMASALMPYEVYFYSSGAIEERWKPSKDLGLNRVNAVLGFGLGGILAIALVMTAAQVFHPLQIQPDSLGTAALGPNVALGQTGLLLAMVGMLFAVGGAAIDTCFAGAYTVAQFCGWEWGKYREARGAPRFTLAWIAMLAAGFVIVATGIDPVMITEYAVVFSVVALPFTYVPVLLIARDKTFMGQYANGRLSSVLGWAYLIVIAVVAIAAVPLLIVTNAGSGL
ncbi:MAG: manganese transport protein [Solirubrobacterales bacterium]|nr:manganese transport protein [Solirubrobacterales bacterium]